MQNAVVDSRLPTGVRVTLYLGPKEQIVSLNDTEYLRGYISSPLGTNSCEIILRYHEYMIYGNGKVFLAQIRRAKLESTGVIQFVLPKTSMACSMRDHSKVGYKTGDGIDSISRDRDDYVWLHYMQEGMI